MTVSITLLMGNLYSKESHRPLVTRYQKNSYDSVENITVFFDEGYLNYSTKDITHLRRSNSKKVEVLYQLQRILWL